MRNFLSVMTIVSCLAMQAWAQKPEIDGTWKLNLTKSMMAGDHPSPEFSETLIFEQVDGEIKEIDIKSHATVFSRSAPDSRTSVILVPDGQVHEMEQPGMFPGMAPAHLKVTAEWQGDTLFVVEQGHVLGGLYSTTERRYFLSSDGTKLIELIETDSEIGHAQERLVFDKQAVHAQS